MPPDSYAKFQQSDGPHLDYDTCVGTVKSASSCRQVQGIRESSTQSVLASAVATAVPDVHRPMSDFPWPYYFIGTRDSFTFQLIAKSKVWHHKAKCAMRLAPKSAMIQALFPLLPLMECSLSAVSKGRSVHFFLLAEGGRENQKAFCEDRVLLPRQAEARQLPLGMSPQLFVRFNGMAKLSEISSLYGGEIAEDLLRICKAVCSLLYLMLQDTH